MRWRTCSSRAGRGRGPSTRISRGRQGAASHGFSVSAAARALHLHTNSLAYRLERWKQLTGWDFRTADGLLRSLASLKLSVELLRRGRTSLTYLPMVTVGTSHHDESEL